jgi:hypothetical protein
VLQLYPRSFPAEESYNQRKKDQVSYCVSRGDALLSLSATRSNELSRLHVVRKTSYIKTVVCSLGLATTSAAWAQNPAPPALLYGTTTSLPPTNRFAIATTIPTLANPRAQYVVIAEENAASDLEVLAWQDTTSSLNATASAGIAARTGVTAVAITGLDASRVVTADVNKKGVLSLHTWTVGAAGVNPRKGYRTAAATALSNVAIARLSSSEVVTAYESPAGQVIVEAWTIAADGLPAPKAVVATGPSAFEVSIAAVTPGQVITAAADKSDSLWVNTWGIDAAGVHAQHQVQTTNAVSASAAQTVAVGAGRSFEEFGGSPVRSAFTPVITPDFQVQAFYWGISDTGVLTLTSTAPPTLAGDFFGVAASMLQRNIPITTYLGGTGDNSVFTEVYTGLNPLTDNPPTYGDPYNAFSIATAPAGTDLSFLSLFNPYRAYFASGGLFGAPEGSPDGTLFINMFSYPEPPIL